MLSHPRHHFVIAFALLIQLRYQVFPFLTGLVFYVIMQIDHPLVSCFAILILTIIIIAFLTLAHKGFCHKKG